jgi:hypothetical protein
MTAELLNYEIRVSEEERDPHSAFKIGSHNDLLTLGLSSLSEVTWGFPGQVLIRERHLCKRKTENKEEVEKSGEY